MECVNTELQFEANNLESGVFEVITVYLGCHCIQFSKHERK